MSCDPHRRRTQGFLRRLGSEGAGGARRLLHCRKGLKPVIGAVDGIAMGGGFEMAPACDIVVALENAVCTLPEPRLGLAALAGGIQRPPHEIGLKRAMGMMLTGRWVMARGAEIIGLDNKVVDGDAINAARVWASKPLAFSPMSVRATKKAVLRGRSRSVLEGLSEEWECPAMKAMLASADAVEGSHAFAEKRKPSWKGR